MKYLLDSDVVIDFLRKKDPGFSIISSIAGKQFYLSVISWAELMYGIEKSSRSEKDREIFNQFLLISNSKILSVDKQVLGKYIDLKLDLEKMKKPLADFDLIIAATASSRDLILVTRNIKHFDRIKGLKLHKIK